MKLFHATRFLAAGILTLGFTACSKVEYTHVAPGKSAAAAIAARNAPPPAAPAPGNLPTLPSTSVASRSKSVPQHIDMLPGLPTDGAASSSNSAAANGAADAYTRASFAMQAGQDAEALKAFEETVKLDPDFTDAWGKMALLYSKSGQSAKATEAFKRAKKLGDANGGTVTRDATGGLQLP